MLALLFSQPIWMFIRRAMAWGCLDHRIVGLEQCIHIRVAS
ncbi:hypothetical protein DVS28_a1079 [Euzebya pacifica]|uniref:Uncharacterized protein n=1 Tax=Euzebya pacifica TaxID=1608957 RepID=A0A346XU83_9ACTN|nr:hypothetical protein DVS28_a1079 [Euzebya pacifica]